MLKRLRVLSVHWAMAASVIASAATFSVWLAPPTVALAQEDLDINKVFWCNSGKNTGGQNEADCVEARGLILSRCTVCHAITPIVKAQKTKPQWLAVINSHRPRVSDLSDADLAKITQFLQAHYTPQNPIPKLPPELDKLGVPPA